MTNFVRIVGSRNGFLACFILIIVGLWKGWLSSVGGIVALVVLIVLGVSSTLISKRS